MRTRFAPSPTGPLHLGHAYSAILAHDMARAAGGEFLLRIEDIDQSRARPEWEELIFDDLRWLGLSWEEPVMRQSERMDAYSIVLRTLWEDQTLYGCACSRRDIEIAASAPQEGVTMGPDGIVYPGTCINLPCNNPWHVQPMPKDKALRLDMLIAIGRPRLDTPRQDWKVSFTEDGAGPHGESGLIECTWEQMLENVGDIVLARKDIGTSYHLSVVLDDAAQDITHVVRGEDLFEATKIHVVLQRLLGLPTPVYHHHRLIRDEHGKRLAKRDNARAIRTFREEGASPQDIRRMVGL